MPGIWFQFLRYLTDWDVLLKRLKQIVYIYRENICIEITTPSDYIFPWSTVLTDIAGHNVHNYDQA